MDLTAQFPVLVYGTLRPTGGNFEYILEEHTEKIQSVRLPGFTMYGTTGFPFMTKGDGQVTFDLITINAERFPEVLKDLDHLEGFRTPGSPRNLYERLLHTFEMNGETVQAWVYVTSDHMVPRLVTTTPVIKSGDWIAHERQARLAAIFDEVVPQEV